MALLTDFFGPTTQSPLVQYSLYTRQSIFIHLPYSHISKLHQIACYVQQRVLYFAHNNAYYLKKYLATFFNNYKTFNKIGSVEKVSNENVELVCLKLILHLYLQY